MGIIDSGFNNRGRTDNVIRNINVAAICQVINTLLGFLVRTIFIKHLGTTYLGLNGIFTNVLTILSFAEMGIGQAIVFNMYSALKDKDELRISALMGFYKKAYAIIGGIVFFLGTLILPFIQYLISEQPDIKESISLIYFLFLLNTVSSYFFAHKKSFLIAEQKNYITNICHQLIHCFQIVAQIALLYILPNYIIYLSVMIGCNVAEGFIISKYVDKAYPFLNKIKNAVLEKKLVLSIKKDVGALFIYKINSAVLHGTDSILIASLVNVETVGYYSNYTLITETANTALGIVTTALVPSVGNLNAEADVKKKESIFNIILYVSAWLYGFVCTGILALSNSFIANWIGSEFLLEYSVVIAIVLQLYIRGVHYAAYTYRETSGLFVQSKYIPVAMTVINLVLSIIFGKKWGLFGVLIATSIARITTIGISDPVLVYRYIFKKNPLKYYLKYVLYLIFVIFSFLVSNFVVKLVTLSGWVDFIVSFLLYTVIFNMLFFVFTFKNEEFQYLKKILKKYFIKLLRKIKILR